MDTPKTIDQHINSFPKEIQEKLQKIRITIQKAAPKASEKISYGIPTFYYKGNLVHFAGFKDHISFFPSSSGVSSFKEDLKGHITGKGTIQFKLDEPIPYSLITKIVKFRVKENDNK